MTLQQLMSPARRAMDDFCMIEDGDVVAVGLSGGKDSVTLLSILAGMRRFYPKKYDLKAITVDMGLGLDQKEVEAMKQFCKDLDVEYVIEKTDIGEVVFDVRKESNPCSLCAKMRRGALNNSAVANGCNVVALGHHADDLVETFFLSMIYEGRLSTFSPITYLTKSKIKIIRPMLYITEKEIAGFAKNNPILHNPCPMDKHTQRQYVKDLIKNINVQVPIAKDRILSALLHPERNNLIGESVEKFKKDFGLKD